MQEARLLVSRVEALENLLKQPGLQSDLKPNNPTSSPFMALHIISDILLMKGNSSNSTVGLPSKVNVNIALKNGAPLIQPGQNNKKFFVNSTVQLLDRSKVAKLDNNGITRAAEFDGKTITEQQVN